MKASDPLFGTASNYNKEMKAAYPEYTVVPYQTAEASNAVYVWKDAFERAQSLDQEKVREALTKTDMETFCGHVRFAADGSNPGKDMIMRQIQGGKYMVVWPTKVAARYARSIRATRIIECSRERAEGSPAFANPRRRLIATRWRRPASVIMQDRPQGALAMDQIISNISRLASRRRSSISVC